MSGVGEGGVPQWVLKDAMRRSAKGLWVAVTWLVPFLPGPNSGARWALNPPSPLSPSSGY